MAAKKMGLSEEEFWNADPIFFIECYERFEENRAKEMRMIYGR